MNSRAYRWIRVVLPVIVQWVLSMAVVTGFRLCAMWAGGSAGGADSFEDAAAGQRIYQNHILLLTAVTHLLTAILMFFWFRKTEKTDHSAGRRAVPGIALCAVLGISSAFLLNFLLNILGVSAFFQKDLETMSDALYHGPILLQIVTVVLLAPAAEELLFRGICQNELKYLFPPRQAILASALLFGMYHGNVLQGIYGFLIGCILGWTYEKKKNLLFPLIVHSAANAFSLLMTHQPEVGYILTGNTGRMILSAAVFLTAAAGSIFLLKRRKK